VWLKYRFKVTSELLTKSNQES